MAGRDVVARGALPRRPRMVYCLAKETTRQMRENHKSSSIGDGPPLKPRPVGGGCGRRKQAGWSRLGMVGKGLLVFALLEIAFWGGVWSDRLWQRRARTRAESRRDVAVAREKAILGVTSEVFIEYSPKAQTISEGRFRDDAIQASRAGHCRATHNPRHPMDSHGIRRRRSRLRG